MFRQGLEIDCVGLLISSFYCFTFLLDVQAGLGNRLCVGLLISSFYCFTFLLDVQAGLGNRLCRSSDQFLLLFYFPI